MLGIKNSNYSTGHASHKRNVYTEVVANNLCIGCGLCAAICPGQNLRIELNEFGEYVAREQDSSCPDTCSMCLDVCPFYDQSENEANKMHEQEDRLLEELGFGKVFSPEQ